MVLSPTSYEDRKHETTRDNAKLWRIFANVNPEVKRGGVVMLQDTHIVDKTKFELYWKNSLVDNCSGLS